jgi:hypothetical protein
MVAVVETLSSLFVASRESHFGTGRPRATFRSRNVPRGVGERETRNDRQGSVGLKG